MSGLVSTIAGELRGVGPCLEIGVGTGRFAVPLARAGLPVFGVDLSAAMLRRLLSNADGVSVPAAQADATRLPFAAGTFGAGIAAHVLHLIPAWRVAIDELIRVVRPGGKLVAFARGRVGAGWLHDLQRVFYSAAGQGAWPPGMDGIEELDAEMHGRGLGVRALPVQRERRIFTVRRSLELLEQGIYSACWALDDATRGRAAEHARGWAEANLGDLDEPRPVVEEMTWRVYDL